MGPFPKRFRPELDGPLSREESPRAAAQQRLQDWGAPPLAGGRGGDHECRRFNTPEGCPYGSSCRFRHVSNGGRQTEQLVLSFGGKTKPCKRFFSTSGCPYGESCHFLHYVPGGLRSLGLAPVVPSTADGASQKPVTPSGDKNLTISYYKTRLCNWFNTPEGCRYGYQCDFAHGVEDLRPPSKVPRGNWGPMGHGPLGTTPPKFINGNPMNANGNFSSHSSPAPHGSSPGTPGTTAVSAATHQDGPVGGGNARIY